MTWTNTLVLKVKRRWILVKPLIIHNQETKTSCKNFPWESQTLTTRPRTKLAVGEPCCLAHGSWLLYRCNDLQDVLGLCKNSALKIYSFSVMILLGHAKTRLAYLWHKFQENLFKTFCYPINQEQTKQRDLKHNLCGGKKTVIWGIGVFLLAAT